MSTVTQWRKGMQMGTSTAYQIEEKRSALFCPGTACTRVGFSFRRRRACILKRLQRPHRWLITEGATQVHGAATRSEDLEREFQRGLADGTIARLEL